MRTLGMMMAESIINEAKRKDWKLPDSSIIHAATKTNISLGMYCEPMDKKLAELWQKYYHMQPNQWYSINPSFKRGTYQKADKIIRDNYTKIETSGDYEIWLQNGTKTEVAFFNKKDKSWNLHHIWLSYYV